MAGAFESDAGNRDTKESRDAGRCGEEIVRHTRERAELRSFELEVVSDSAGHRRPFSYSEENITHVENEGVNVHSQDCFGPAL